MVKIYSRLKFFSEDRSVNIYNKDMINLNKQSEILPPGKNQSAC